MPLLWNLIEATITLEPFLLASSHTPVGFERAIAPACLYIPCWSTLPPDNISCPTKFWLRVCQNCRPLSSGLHCRRFQCTRKILGHACSAQRSTNCAVHVQKTHAAVWEPLLLPLLECHPAFIPTTRLKHLLTGRPEQNLDS